MIHEHLIHSLENYKSLQRMELTQRRMENILLASLLLNIAGPILSSIAAEILGAAHFGFQTFMAGVKKKSGKTRAKFVETKFVDDKD